MSAELRVDNLRKVFATGRPAVDGVTFRVPVGEIIVLLGPSGCGKTTTLRCVAGLEHPTEGSISIGGKIVSQPSSGILVPPRLREIGMVFQSYAVWPHMTVYQNVAYPLRHRKVGAAEADRKVKETLELVGLSEYASRSVTALSGGQMQRVALARSLVYQPQILLLDEPLSNLDAKLRLRLRDDLRRIIKAAGVTALYVTHDQGEAVALGDRIGVMRDGLLLQLASPEEIYGRPSDLFVASFTGASNVLHGTVLDRSGDTGTVDIGAGRRLSATMSGSLGPGERASIAIRPENVILVGPDDPTGHFRARVAEQRFQGIQTQYQLDVGAGLIEALELGTSPRFAIGNEVSVKLPTEVCWAYKGIQTVELD